MRQLVTLSEDPYCKPFVVIFQGYIQLAVTTTDAMADWFDRLSLLLSSGDSESKDNDSDNKDKKCISSLTIMLEEVSFYLYLYISFSIFISSLSTSVTNTAISLV
jgi:hypothetical protein